MFPNAHAASYDIRRLINIISIIINPLVSSVPKMGILNCKITRAMMG